jgi:hypothetical protein
MFTKGFIAAVDFASRTLTFFVDKLSSAIGALGNFVTNLALGMSGLAYRAVNAASSLTELKNAATIYVGKGASSQIFGTAMDYQSKYGLSATDSMRIMMRVAGQLRQTTSMGGDAAGKEAIRLFDSVAEAGSVLNMSIDDMGKMIQSALAGRYTPLRRMGVAVSAPYLDMVARQQGFDKNAATPFEARTKSLVYEVKRQTAPFMGDLAATQYEFANQQRKLLGLFESLFVQAGRVLEPFAKVIMITSNEVLTIFNDRLRKTAESASNLKGGLLDRFGAAVARAGDYVLYFADKIYANRETIASKIEQVITTVLDAAKNLVVFSLRMMSVVAGLVETFQGLIPTVKSVTMSIASLAEFIGRMTGFTSPEFKAAQIEQTKDKDKVIESRVKTANFKKWWNVLDITTGQELSRIQREAAAAQSRLDQVANGMPISYVYGTNKGPMAGEGISEKLTNLAESVASIKTPQDLAKFFSDLSGAAPNVFGNAMDKAMMQVNRPPNFIPPGQFSKEETGRLVSYFSPAAYRDEIQTRSVNAMERVADNTDKIVEYMGSSDKMSPLINMPAITVK